jgi:hypothetical protein
MLLKIRIRNRNRLPLIRGGFLFLHHHHPTAERLTDQMYDSRTGRSSTAEHALHARLVDGRSADIVTLGKIAQGDCSRGA